MRQNIPKDNFLSKIDTSRFCVHKQTQAQKSYPGKDNTLSGYFTSFLRRWLRQNILKGYNLSKIDTSLDIAFTLKHKHRKANLGKIKSSQENLFR